MFLRRFSVVLVLLASVIVVSAQEGRDEAKHPPAESISYGFVIDNSGSFRKLLEDDSTYGGRDEVYFYLAESLARTDKKPEAIPYFERVLTEFDFSEHMEEAKRRLEELKTQIQAQ